MPESDFTSAHFLGLSPTGTCTALTTGRPAAVERHEHGRGPARVLARTQGAEDGIVARSSLHGLVDVLATAAPPATVLVDEGIYPVGQWAAGAVGAEVLTFRHHDAGHAARRMPRRRAVVVLTDGLCGSCLRPAPLAELAEVTERYAAELVVDDTLATGVLGSRGPADQVLGSGGGGTASWLGLPPGSRVTVASLAKGLAAPLAVITGPTTRMEQIRREGPTRVHASPPTASDIAALAHALEQDLDPVRSRLGQVARRVRALLDDLGLRPLGIPFPVVATEGGRQDPLELRSRLAAGAVLTLATTGRCTGRPTLTLCLRADHTPGDLARLERVLVGAVTGEAA